MKNKLSTIPNTKKMVGNININKDTKVIWMSCIFTVDNGKGSKTIRSNSFNRAK